MRTPLTALAGASLALSLALPQAALAACTPGTPSGTVSLGSLATGDR